MDLKDVVANLQVTSAEALSAFNAGHHDKAEERLMAQMIETGKYFDEKTKPAGDVTGSATSEKPAESLEETQAKVSGSGVHPAVIDPVAAAQQIGTGSVEPKPPQ
ncbi:hypothetical protein ES703_37980 [subsurface metagenome]